jgi:class 3 adenylate cyclase
MLVMATFGIPPQDYDNSVIRGLKSALTLKKDLHRFGLKFSIGIVTGPIIYGNFQGGNKRANLILGNAVTSCDSLTALEGDDIRCDKETYDASRGAIAFDAMGYEDSKDTKCIFRPLGIYLSEFSLNFQVKLIKFK